MSTSGLLYEHLRSWATIRPGAPFLIEAETGVTLTYERSFAACQAMRQTIGAAPRSILLGLPGGIANAVVWLSALTGGHTLIPIAPDAPAQEEQRVTVHFPPDVIIADEATDRARNRKRAALILTGSDCERLMYDAQPGAGPVFPPGAGRVCLRTSGSSGQPKSVLLGEQQIAWAARQISRSHQLSPEDRGLAVLPFFHVNAPVVSLCASLLAGSSVVIAPRFSRSRFWPWVEHYRVTWASIVPTIVGLLLQTELPASLPGALRFVRTASAPLPAIQLLQFERQFGVPLIETYGLTEAASQVCANPLPPERHVPGSVGKPVGVALRVCRPDTAAGQPLQEVAPGEAGEICVAGSSVVSGYVGGAETGTFQDGWFRTGDLGYRDAEGYLYLIGRRREIILRGGESIAPREIEEVLLAHPAVRESAVIGHPDALYGERVVAHVVVQETWTEALEKSLRAHCADHLTKHKVPSAFMPAVALPRTLTGKIDRQRLVQEGTLKTPEGDIHAA
jgi:acyl-CoA synthetase (AMP-forming)/AMP-acid ligase II